MSPTRTPCLDSSRQRSSRQRATIAVAVTVLAVVPATAASGFWRQPTPGGAAVAGADALVAPGAPTITREADTLVATWGPAALQSGKDLPGGMAFTYDLERVPADEPPPQWAAITCDGSLGAAVVATPPLSCTHPVEPGQWLYRVVARLGSWSAASTTVEVDTRDIEVTLSTSGTQGANGWFRSPVDVTVSANANGGAVECTLATGDAPAERVPCTGPDHPVHLGDGRHHLTATATLGLRRGHADLDVKVDATDPSPGAIDVLPRFVNGPVPLALVPPADDGTSGVASVEWFECDTPGCGPIRDSERAPFATSALPPYGTTWPPAPGSVAEGVHRFRARVTDNAGNRALTNIRDTVVDTSPPTVRNVQPVDGAVVGGSGVVFGADAGDATSGLANVQFEFRPVGQPAAPWTVLLDPPGAAASGAKNLFPQPNGDYELRVVATDRAGNATMPTDAQRFTIRNWRATAITFSNAGTPGTATGKVDQGDTVAIAFNRTPDSALLCPGSPLSPTVRVVDGGANVDELLIEPCAGASLGRLTLGTGSYVTGGDAVFDATISIATAGDGAAVVTVTIGSRRAEPDAGTGALGTSVNGARAVYSPNPALRSTDGVPIDPTPAVRGATRQF